ncbi:uncharacterized protein LY89DRAFT_349426 [Mollisia scopiformis]|uniref:Nephrocystin 3-like N-terminal domain-containing protein n=1 Tax=Mollisia scopiformis TaxID=149040 RepID=A0A132B762_MOLSC|nr:uncharacterized protein LY89DRAFT_349426 [Mollisia scopiformis]KUJ08083.1 hypothetical protein LY89DRAFT_349426 [Mollisia scopiformis]
MQYDSCVVNIKEWINSPEYMREFENARGKRLPDTGEWLLALPSYQSWKMFSYDSVSENKPLPADLSRSILFLTAKPGYGKTTLSSLIIEDLRATSPGGKGLILFYHFTSDDSMAATGSKAFRAILVQLVHENRIRKEIIDTS